MPDVPNLPTPFSRLSEACARAKRLCNAMPSWKRDVLENSMKPHGAPRAVVRPGDELRRLREEHDLLLGVCEYILSKPDGWAYDPPEVHAVLKLVKDAVRSVKNRESTF